MHARPRILVLTVTLTLVVCAMLASVAMAAPGGKAKAGSATLAVSSGDVVSTTSALPANGPLHVTGTGYVAGQGVTIVMYSPTAASWFGGPADADGNISIDNTTNSAGSYKMEAYQDLGNGQKGTLMARVTFEVQ